MKVNPFFLSFSKCTWILKTDFKHLRNYLEKCSTVQLKVSLIMFPQMFKLWFCGSRKLHQSVSFNVDLLRLLCMFERSLWGQTAVGQPVLLVNTKTSWQVNRVQDLWMAPGSGPSYSRLWTEVALHLHLCAAGISLLLEEVCHENKSRAFYLIQTTPPVTTVIQQWTEAHPPSRAPAASWWFPLESFCSSMLV